MSDVERYEALAFCINCGFEGPVAPEVGRQVYTEPCPVCQTGNLVAQAMREWDHELHPRPDAR